VILALAIVVAVVAAGAVYYYLNTVQDRANHNAKLVDVFKVAKDIPQGTSGDAAIDQGYIKKDREQLKFHPATAIADINTIRSKVALTNLPANLPVVEGLFVDPKVAAVTAAKSIPAGQVALTISVDTVHGVAGFIQPGDKVDMMLGSPDGERFLYQNVNVLFVGTSGATSSNATQAPQGGQSGTLTLAVPPAAALKIAQVGANVYLALVPPENQPVPVPPQKSDASLFAGGLTPYGA
jgi:Flp pilus assembly protein CpaB